MLTRNNISVCAADALGDLDKALELGFQRAEAFTNRGVIHTMMDNWPDRDGHGTDGTEGTDGTNGTQKSYRSHWSYSSYGSPAADFDQAVAIGPPRAEAYNNRGVLRAGCGEREQAITDFDDAIRVYPDFAPAWANRAIARAGLDQVDMALEDVRTMMQFAPFTMLQVSFSSRASRSSRLRIRLSRQSAECIQDSFEQWRCAVRFRQVVQEGLFPH